MKLTVSKEALVGAMNDVIKAVSNKASIPILTGVLIQVTEKGLILTGSDNEITIQRTIPREEKGSELVSVEETGQIVLPAKYFNELIRKLTKEDVSMVMEQNRVVEIKSGKSKFEINGLDPEEYPKQPAINNEKAVKIPATTLKRIVLQTSYAVSTNETRPILKGISLNLDGEILTAIATDSHRLAKKSIALKADGAFNAVIPGRSLNDVVKILDDDKEDVTLSITDNQALFETSNKTFLTRLSEGKYPDVSRLVNIQDKIKIEVNVKELAGALDRTMLFTKDTKTSVVKMVTREGQQLLEIESNDPEVGKATEQVSCKMSGGDVKIAFSAKFFLSALQAAQDADTVTVHITDPMKPIFLTIPKQDDFVQLILPVRTY